VKNIHVMRDTSVAIKGVKEGLVIALDETEEWGALLSDLAARIDGQSAFFAGARITLDVGARPVRKDELGSIKALLDRRGLTLYAVVSESETTIDAAAALDLRANLSPSSQVAKNTRADDGAAFASEEEGTTGIMIRRTLRSGRTVRSMGHVVVYGDVNPGAEIIAAGDVIVWGRLRGNVHAGANGDESAVVCALDMIPTQLRIAGYISVSPPDKRHRPKPEIALIRGGQIVVEPWSEPR
jgi:septum site-determining protein MinC